MSTEAEVQAVVHDLALEIADEAARGAIEVNCISIDVDCWNTRPSSIPEIDRDHVARAVRYLELRGKIIHHHISAFWVRFQND